MQGCPGWGMFWAWEKNLLPPKLGLYPPKLGLFDPGLGHILGLKRKLHTNNHNNQTKSITYSTMAFSKCLDSGGSNIQSVQVWKDIVIIMYNVPYTGLFYETCLVK